MAGITSAIDLGAPLKEKRISVTRSHHSATKFQGRG